MTKKRKCKDCKNNIHIYSDLCKKCITRYIITGVKPAWEPKEDKE